MRQVKVVNGNTERTFWADTRKDLKIDDQITIKGESLVKWWTIVWISDTELDKHEIHEHWKVGGL